MLFSCEERLVRRPNFSGESRRLEDIGSNVVMLDKAPEKDAHGD